ncbi:ankyrin repeat domain-containing protein [Campylobacter sp. MIT 97-5078]|uniref:ankyrin repeat domain-containing protein n=1 Tax=Campylobacter sp. MIT 97-5078 TaxID=1548153 RepID=UPI00068A1D66|nr:ankyrin repeat domain-containing protein [Campylobacter sp. MIT 97-5078]TQR27239.1 ankyrin repeat domain-containing protein [Campylobacter sp. MIT 97-5078]
MMTYFYLANSVLMITLILVAIIELLRSKAGSIALYKKLCLAFVLFVFVDICLSLYQAKFLSLVLDIICLAFVIWLLRALNSPFYKALSYLQQKDYLAFYLILLGFDKWYEARDFRGFALLHYALMYKLEANVFKAILGQELKFNAYDEDSFADILRKTQKEQALKPCLSAELLHHALNVKCGKKAKFRAFSGTKTLNLSLDKVGLLSFSALCGDLFMLDFLHKQGLKDESVQIKGFKLPLHAGHFALLNAEFIAFEWLNEHFDKIDFQILSDDERFDRLSLAVLDDDITRLEKYQDQSIKDMCKHPIFLAASFGKLKSLEFLLQTKPYLKELRDEEDLSLLDRTMKFQSLASFKYLIEKSGFSFAGKLFLAVSEASEAILEYMLKNGYKIKAEEVCLCYYLWFDSTDDTIFKRLCKIGTDFIDQEGDTPLLVAVKANLTQKASKLIKAGANIDIKDAQGKTALDYARTNDNTELIALLDRSFEEV